MSILVPKAHRDGSQLGMHKREWSNILSEQMYSSASIINGATITSGSTEESMELLRRKMAIHKKLQYICLDVANGYREDFLQFVRR